METTLRNHRSAGWQQEETEKLFQAVKDASEAGVSLRSVFEALAEGMGRKPNSIRNHYYACLREHPQDAPVRQTPARVFTSEETHELLRRVLMAQGQGMSVRSCVMQMAEGDRSRMLRYQNKYRTLLRNRPDMIDAVREELMQEGLPCPDPALPERADCTFCDPEDTAAATLMAEPCISAMLEGLKELLHRAAHAGDAQERQRQLDRLQVQSDLQRLAWEKDFDEARAQLDSCLSLLREFLGLPEEEQYLQMDTFRHAAMDCITAGENFLTRTQY